MNFEYVTLCFINMSMICHFQKMQSAYHSRERRYKYNNINANILLFILKKNYSMENIPDTTVIKGI